VAPIPTTCAVCGKGGALDPYRDIARSHGWPHEYAHLDCVRYRVASTCPVGHRVFYSSGCCYSMRESSIGIYEYVIGECNEVEAACQ